MGEAFRASEAKAHAVSGSKAVTESQIDVRDTGTLIFKYDAYAGFSIVAEGFQQDRTSAPIIDRIARKFAGRSYELRLIDDAETQGHGELAGRLPDQNNIVRTLKNDGLRA
jgi:hypothetical protein